MKLFFVPLLAAIGILPMAGISAANWQDSVTPTPSIPLGNTSPAQSPAPAISTTPSVTLSPNSRPLPNSSLTPNSYSAPSSAPLAPAVGSPYAAAPNSIQAPAVGTTTPPRYPNQEPYGAAPSAPAHSQGSLPQQGPYPSVPAAMSGEPAPVMANPYGITPSATVSPAWAQAPTAPGASIAVAGVDLIDAQDQQLTRSTLMLAERLSQSEGEERTGLEAELRKLITSQFEHRQEQRRREIEELENRLADIRTRVETRESNKDQIIDRRFRELSGDEEFLWEEDNSIRANTNRFPRQTAQLYSDLYQAGLAPMPTVDDTPTSIIYRPYAIATAGPMYEPINVPIDRGLGRVLTAEEKAMAELLRSEWTLEGSDERKQELIAAATTTVELLSAHTKYSDQDVERMMNLIERGLVPISQSPISGPALKDLCTAREQLLNRIDALSKPLSEKLTNLGDEVDLLTRLIDSEQDETRKAELKSAIEALKTELSSAESRQTDLTNLREIARPQMVFVLKGAPPSTTSIGGD